MGNSSSTLADKSTKLVSVNVGTLKERLNKFYEMRHLSRASHDGIFEYLWDLKELALMEGRNEVDVPANWLEELEDNRPARGH